MFRKLIAAKRLRLHDNCILQITEYYIIIDKKQYIFCNAVIIVKRLISNV